jgi:hypothetical protein
MTLTIAAMLLMCIRTTTSAHVYMTYCAHDNKWAVLFDAGDRTYLIHSWEEWLDISANYTLPPA